MATDTELIADAVREPLQQVGLLLEDVSVRSTGDFRVVGVVVDLAGQTAEPVAMEQIEQATRIVSEHVDALPLFDGLPYSLEVSSPGAERKLTEPRHFRRVVGRRLEVFTDKQRYEGDLVAVDDGAAGSQITLAKTKAGHDTRPGKGPKVADPLVLSLADINRAGVLLSFR